MSEHQIHENHDHEHGPGCGHIAIKHGDHVDYLHDGHLHHKHGDHYVECKIEVTEQNPDECNPVEAPHQHGEDCGCPQVPHGDHVDYLVDGRLQHVHGDHVDDHGPVEVIEN